MGQNGTATHLALTPHRNGYYRWWIGKTPHLQRQLDGECIQDMARVVVGRSALRVVLEKGFGRLLSRFPLSLFSATVPTMPSLSTRRRNLTAVTLGT